MLELSDILQKNLISKETSQIIGCIKNVYFSKSCDKIAYFVAEDCINNIHLISPPQIDSFSDALMLNSLSSVKSIDDIDFTRYAKDLINKPVYTQNGILKGYISSVQFSKQGKISKLTAQEYSFSPQAVDISGDVILLKTQKRNTKSPKIILPKPTADTPVDLFENIDKGSDEANQSAALETTKQIVNIYSAPPATRLYDGTLFSNNALKVVGVPQEEAAITRIISDYDFLLGRTLKDNLTTFSGKLLAKKEDIVTAQTIETARLAGKLTELVLISG